MRFNPFRLFRGPSASSKPPARLPRLRTRRHGLRLEALEQRALLAIGAVGAVTPETAGAYSPFDTNRDGYVTAIDALLIVNEINRTGGGRAVSAAGSADGLAMAAALPGHDPLDINGDGYVTALDALLVINQLNDETEEMVNIRLEITDLNDNPITEVAAGGAFRLRTHVLDLRSTGNTGVFAAFLDVTWDPDLATATSEVDKTGSVYTSGPTGTVSPGLIDEAGGISGQFSPPLGPSERFLFSVDFEAGLTPGTVLFLADPADVFPVHNTLLFDIGTAIPTTQIVYGSASVTIVAGPAFSINSPTPVIEGNVGTTPMVFEVTLSEASDVEVTVDYATEDITATAGEDYVAASGTLTFAPGETSKQIIVDIIGDTLSEDTEIFAVVLSNASAGAGIAEATGIGMILDDDAPVTVSIQSPDPILEGNTNSILNFTVSLSEASGQVVTVQYATQAGTALAGSDFVAAAGTLTFQPGETLKLIPITIIGDDIDEATETFQVVLSSPTGANLGTAAATGTILDNDPLPSLLVSSPTVSEPASGTANMVFTISLSKASGQPITVSYRTLDGTAEAGLDYTAVAPTQLTFEPGETSKQVVVTIHSDDEVEGDETLILEVSAVGLPAIETATGTGVITDAVTGKQIRIRLATTDLDGNPISQVQATDTFLVAGYVEDVRSGEDLVGVFQAYVDILYDTGLISATGPINFGADFPNGQAGSVATPGLINDIGAAGGEIFPADPSGQKLLFTVQVTALLGGVAQFTPVGAENSPLRDILMYGGEGPVPDEEVLFQGASITILPPPAISIGPASVVEGDSGQTPMIFTVTLSAAGTKTVTVDYATLPITATPGVDYQPVSGTLTFEPGEVSKTISVLVFGDTLDEDDETFQVVLSNPANSTISVGTAVGTIIDDDLSPTLSVSNADAIEGFSDAEFVITLSQASGRTVTVNYATAGGTATSDVDFQSVAGQLVFAPGETTKTVIVPVFFDTIVEGTETFTLALSSPVNATIAAGTGVGSISDLPLSSLSGWVYRDLNGNGARDGDEQGLSGITITLTGTDLFGAAVFAEQQTKSDGSYSFVGLLPGTYALAQTQPVALADGLDSVGTLGGVLSNDFIFGIVVGPGQHGAEYNFGEGGLHPDYLHDGNFYASSLNGRK